MSSWHDRMEQDASLRAFVAARIGQAVVELASLRVEHQRDQEAIAHLRERVKELEAQNDGGQTRTRKAKR